jgi:PII-like signaling protein
VPAAGLRLSVYAGERDHVGGRLLADALMGAWSRAGVRAAVLLRGAEGFGLKHRLHTEQLLTLSEDLPTVAIAFDRPEVILSMLEEARPLLRHGLITLERVRLLDVGDGVGGEDAAHDELKLTLLGARGARAGAQPAYVAAVGALRRCGLSGASVMLGVDGVERGLRRRARLRTRNPSVPLLIGGVGSAEAIARALVALSSFPGVAPLALERVRICKRDGVLLAPPHEVPASMQGGVAWWQKLTVQSGERDAQGRHPLHGELVRRLRAGGAAGATALRAQWGYGGEHEPHGERVWSLARDTPVRTVICDTPDAIRRSFELVDLMTARTGLVTSELIPVLRAAAPGVVHGGLDVTGLDEPGAGA